MGTRIRLVAWAPTGVLAAALDEVDRLDALLSPFRPESPLSQLNRRAGLRFAAPDELRRFVARALEIAERTGGAFDPTIGPVSEALRRSQDGEDLQAARALVGFHRVHVTEDAIVFGTAGMTFDPGGIGKGWALDTMFDRLRAWGVQSAFADFGGSSFQAMGRQPSGSGFRVRVRGATGEQTGPVIELCDAALSTSMSLAMPESPGQPPRPHIVDPRSGRFVEVARIAAVVAPTGAEADALSTALVVLGPEGADVIDGFVGTAAFIQELGQPPVFRGELPIAR